MTLSYPIVAISMIIAAVSMLGKRPKLLPKQGILTGNGVTYSPTAADRLWLLRAVQTEGPSYDHVAQVLINGFMAARSLRGYDANLASYVQAYSQPVNPRWLPDGDLHLARLSKAPTELARNGLIVRARRREQYRKETTFTQSVRESVARALADGPTGIAKNATDFAAQWANVAPKFIAVSESKPGFNSLYTRPETSEWQGYGVA